MEKLQVFSKLLFTAAMCYVATAVILFTLELGKTRESIPGLLKQVEQVEASAGIPQILAQVAKITKEVSAVRAEIPAVLAQLEKTRAVVPSVLKEVALLRENTVPAVLKEMQLAQQKTIPAVLKEVQLAQQTTIPSVLTEVADVRKEIPDLLARTQGIMDDARNISSQASKGAVEGVFKGVLSAPLNLIKVGVEGAVDGAKDLTGKK